METWLFLTLFDILLNLIRLNVTICYWLFIFHLNTIHTLTQLASRTQLHQLWVNLVTMRWTMWLFWPVLLVHLTKCYYLLMIVLTKLVFQIGNIFKVKPALCTLGQNNHILWKYTHCIQSPKNNFSISTFLYQLKTDPPPSVLHLSKLHIKYAGRPKKSVKWVWLFEMWRHIKGIKSLSKASEVIKGISITHFTRVCACFDISSKLRHSFKYIPECLIQLTSEWLGRDSGRHERSMERYRKKWIH